MSLYVYATYRAFTIRYLRIRCPNFFFHLISHSPMNSPKWGILFLSGERSICGSMVSPARCFRHSIISSCRSLIYYTGLGLIFGLFPCMYHLIGDLGLCSSKSPFPIAASICVWTCSHPTVHCCPQRQPTLVSWVLRLGVVV